LKRIQREWGPHSGGGIMKDDRSKDIYYLEPEELSAGPGFSDQERTVLARVNRRVAAGESLKEIIDFLFRETQPIMPCDRIAVAFVEEGGQRLSLYYAVASYSPLLLDSGYASDLQGSSLEVIFAARTPRIINDLEGYFRDHPQSESTRLLLREGVRSSMTCPLSVEGRAVGLLFRSSRAKDAYSERELKLHLAVAERLSQAVEKAYRYEQLSAAYNSYMEMLDFVTHEIKSPLASIITLAKTMSAGYFGTMEERHREMMERIIKRAEHLNALSNEYLNLSRFESGRMRARYRRIDFVDEVARFAIENIAPQMEAAQTDFENPAADTHIPIECDADLLRIVMTNLLSNAVKFGRVRGRIRLRMGVESESLLVSVWNEGPGFPESEKRFLFRKFSRLHTEELQGRKGTGIGLYICWRIVQLHHGHIWADSRKGEWAEFSFRLPLLQTEEDSPGTMDSSI